MIDRRNRWALKPILAGLVQPGIRGRVVIMRVLDAITATCSRRKDVTDRIPRGCIVRLMLRFMLHSGGSEKSNQAREPDVIVWCLPAPGVIGGLTKLMYGGTTHGA